MRIFSLLFLLLSFSCFAIELGVDRVFSPPYDKQLKGKKIGLITNQTGANRHAESTMELFSTMQDKCGYELKALFAPEHGLYGDVFADKEVASSKTETGTPIFSLYGATRRPTAEMLKEISLLVFDIQDIGTRSYTYASTLFYAMEEAAKKKIPVMVLDRPNPINGLTVDGPMVEEEFRSFLGYINVPYCHGMTIGELAKFFNEEHKVGCDLTVIPMKGYRRAMSYADTGLNWIPTSPYIPEAQTSFFYPSTGFLGDMRFVSIGIGYTLPFRVVAAPWIDGEKLASHLNRHKLQGVRFYPIRIRPLTGSFANKCCRGVMIMVTNPQTYLPVTTQYLMLSAIKELYPKEMLKAVASVKAQPVNFFKVCGTKSVLDVLQKEKSPFTALKKIHSKERGEFLEVRKKYLHPDY